MKTSIDLPDNLYRQVKAKSALEGKTVREVATALFAAYATGSEATTEAVSEAMQDAVHDAPEPADRGARLRRLLEREVWPAIPPHPTRLTKAEEEALLGYGETGA